MLNDNVFFKRKAELALEQMEAELTAAIKQHQDLRADLHEVLQRAKKRILDEDGNLNTDA